MQKFENMDVIAALEAIMHQNTAYYQSDFAYDIKMLREAARSDQPEDKLLLWLSRPSGTFCFRERDVLLKDTQAAVARQTTSVPSIRARFSNLFIQTSPLI